MLHSCGQTVTIPFAVGLGSFARRDFDTALQHDCELSGVRVSRIIEILCCGEEVHDLCFSLCQIDRYSAWDHDFRQFSNLFCEDVAQHDDLIPF